MTPEHRAWLALVDEEPIEPELPICDAHHHLWRSTSLYPGDVYLADDLAADSQVGHNVRSTVFVDCLAGYLADGQPEFRPTGETSFAVENANRLAELGGPRLGAIVSFVDLTLGARVAPVLDRHAELGNGLFRGVRYATASDPDPRVRGNHIGARGDALTAQPVIAGLQILAEKEMTFDAWLYHHQLPQIAYVAEQVPELSIIVDHLGGPLGSGPYVGDAAVRPLWREYIARIAACDNVTIKLGGIAMASLGADWDGQPRPATSLELADRWADDVNYVVETFGPERCMFESNFPVDRHHASYGVLWNSFKRIAADWDQRAKQHTFHDTAARVYSIAAGS